ITGSNGKTTTTTLIGQVLRATGRPIQVGGNIGTAMSALVETSQSESINVVEVSSFQLDGIQTFRPNVAVLLNITPDHLDRYRDFNAYRAFKFRIFESQSSFDVAVMNMDDPQVYPPPGEIQSRQSYFSQYQVVSDGGYRVGGSLYLDGQLVMSVEDVML